MPSLPPEMILVFPPLLAQRGEYQYHFRWQVHRFL